MARAFCLSVLLLTFWAPACSGGDDDDSVGSGGSAGTPNLALGGSGAQSSGSAGEMSTPVDGGAPSAGSSSSSGGQPDTATGGTAGTSSGGAGLYLPCESAADCKKYGGGKICCATATMHFCTKQSACTGKILP